MIVLKEKGCNALKERREVAKEERELEIEYRLRQPHSPTPFEQFEAELPDDQKPFAKKYWHMQCKHEHEEQVVTNPAAEKVEPMFVRCMDCGVLRRWAGSRTATRMAEWIGYCPDGFDMFEWEELFDRDRSLWQFIHEEVLVSMVDESMREEAA